MPRLLLVNPVRPQRAALQADIRINFPPLNLAYVAAYTPAHWDVRIADENAGPLELPGADLVGITAFTVNAPRAYEVAARYRGRGVAVVMGGIHVSMRPDEALAHCDAIVVGEAETVWPEVLADWENGRLQEVYVGSPADLAHLRRPRRDLLSQRYVLGSVQTARGCPFDCEFCSVTAFSGRRYRQRPVGEVVDEVGSLRARRFDFIDDNLFGCGSNAVERATELFRGMVGRGIRKSWAAQASVNIAEHPEALRWAARAGCTNLFIGYESADQATLRSMGKRQNLSQAGTGYAEGLREIQRHGIAVFGSFIIGNDEDDESVVESLCDLVLTARMDIAVACLLTPLPGTRLYERLDSQGRLLRTDYPGDWVNYDLTEVVYQPRRMSARAAKQCQITIHDRLLLGRMPERRAFWTLARTRRPLAAFVSYRINKILQRVHAAGRAWHLGHDLATTPAAPAYEAHPQRLEAAHVEVD